MIFLGGWLEACSAGWLHSTNAGRKTRRFTPSDFGISRAEQSVGLSGEDVQI